MGRARELDRHSLGVTPSPRVTDLCRVENGHGDMGCYQARKIGHDRHHEHGWPRGAKPNGIEGCQRRVVLLGGFGRAGCSHSLHVMVMNCVVKALPHVISEHELDEEACRATHQHTRRRHDQA